MQLRQNLWLIFKEMITNAVRHSNASKISVSLKHRSGKLHVVVDDNGAGMDPAAPTAGNGLKNIRRRAEMIGGKVSLDTAPGKGTRWELILKL
ncbi:MAG: hypothetical protein EA363_10405 [Balneolaceae bacterium]|nr:MAG: hypothetical protein EA363_10405 [Balneolaceae bacterium]